MLHWTAFGQTDIGLCREENQDRCVLLREGRILCVSDGMGGMESGAKAAQAVVDGVGEIAAEAGGLSEDALGAKLELLNGSLFKAWKRRSGATLALLALDGDDMLVVTSGDSETYLFREGKLLPIGRPHNEFSSMLAAGEVDPDDLHHPARSYLTAFMGMPPPWKKCITRIPAREGDAFIACSDGICGMLTRTQLEEILRTLPPTSEFARLGCERLTKAALAAGGFDNTAIAIAYAPTVNGPRQTHSAC